VGVSVVWVRTLGGVLEAWEVVGGLEIEDARVEVCDDGAFAGGDWDIFMACAFDNGEGNGFLRH
jgi:hypothetical protein